MDPYIVLIVLHVIGTVLGVGGATFIEVFLAKAMRDGHVDPVEGDFLKTTFFITRVGLVVTVLSGFAFLLSHAFRGSETYLYNSVFWAKMTIVAVIAVNALLLQAHKIPIWLGSALSFVSWYAVLILGVFLRGFSAPYWEIMLYYVVAVLLGGGILDFIRQKMSKLPEENEEKSKPSSTNGATSNSGS